MTTNPIAVYSSHNDDRVSLVGKGRHIEYQNRTAWHAGSAHSHLKLPINLNAFPRGTLTLWILPLEDLSHRYPCADQRKAHPGTDFNNHILIGDQPDLQNVHDSSFALIWDPGWYPQYWAKFFKGYLYHDGFRPERKLLTLAGLCRFERIRWVQLALSWDKPAGQCALFVNGIRVGSSAEDTFLHAEASNDCLYAGNTAFAIGEVAVYSEMLAAEALESHYLQTVSAADPDYQQSLRDMYYGENPKAFAFTPDSSWKESLALSLQDPADLKQFYIQGRTEAPRITAAGLEVETVENYPPTDRSIDDLEQVYLWTERTFEGDMDLTYEYMPLKPGGLSLLLTQASGMQGEDFMADYPRRTTGSMSMVCWENIRNYHWEYYREVPDVPAGSASSGLIKNPWTTPLAYRCESKPTAQQQWHRLEFLQQGKRLRGASTARSSSTSKTMASAATARFTTTAISPSAACSAPTSAFAICVS